MDEERGPCPLTQKREKEKGVRGEEKEMKGRKWKLKGERWKRI